MNRTAVVPGKKLAPKAEAMLELCAAATEAAVAAVRAGITAAEVHRASARFLDENAGGSEQYLYPMAGHGIGLETVEAPLIQPDNETVLAAGMVLCVEPTFNLPEVGGVNVEQMVLVQQGDCEILTKMPTRPWRG